MTNKTLTLAFFMLFLILAISSPTLEGTGHKVAGGDWQVSPSGDRLVFVSSLDYSLWLIEFE
jgi:hypothetical protein